MTCVMLRVNENLSAGEKVWAIMFLDFLTNQSRKLRYRKNVC